MARDGLKPHAASTTGRTDTFWANLHQPLPSRAALRLRKSGGKTELSRHHLPDLQGFSVGEGGTNLRRPERRGNSLGFARLCAPRSQGPGRDQQEVTLTANVRGGSWRLTHAHPPWDTLPRSLLGDAKQARECRSHENNPMGKRHA